MSSVLWFETAAYPPEEETFLRVVTLNISPIQGNATFGLITYHLCSKTVLTTGRLKFF
jgi:hypothetical protein